MYFVQLNKRINQIISLFYRVGFWHRGELATVRETRLKLFYSIYFVLFPISLMAGAVESVDRNEAIFLIEIQIAATVMFLKLLFVIWKKKEILELLNRICVYTVDSHKESTLVNNGLERLMKFVTISFPVSLLTAACAALVVPFLGSERTLFYNIGFPLDWKNNEVAYWIAFTFLGTEIALSAFTLLFYVIIWYLMISCALRYKVQGNQLKNMGVMKTVDERDNKRKRSDVENENLFRWDLISAIKSHKHINELTNGLDSFLSTVFLVQIATSGFCICGSTYSIVYNSGGNLIENGINIFILCYNFFDIYMVMYFGNEIKLSSDRLSYCLFESDWIGRSNSTKKIFIIFGELLMQPRELVILTLYPLNLETFMRILNGAYSMFNILVSLQ